MDRKRMKMRKSSSVPAAKMFAAVCIFMLVGVQLRAAADTYEWTGHNYLGVDNEDTVYIYNVATGYFLNQGGYWGTQPGLRSVGIPVHIDTLSVTNGNGSGPNQQQTTTNYGPLIRSNVNPASDCTGYIGYVDAYYVSSGTALDTARLYIDRYPTSTSFSGSSYGSTCVMKFSEVTDITDATVYNISVTPTNGTTYYWTAKENDGKYEIDLTTDISAKGDSA